MSAIKVLAPILTVAAGVAVMAGFIITKPKPKKVSAASGAARVNVQSLDINDQPVRIFASGRVEAIEQVELRPELSGRVVWRHPAFTDGNASIQKGEVLVRLDNREYRLMVEEQMAAVKRAEVELALEEGRRDVALKEWDLLRKNNPQAEANPLSLREPQLKSAQVGLASAKSGLARARLNVSRTEIRAPFNAIVRQGSVEVGQIVDRNSRLAQLVGTDAFRVRTNMPLGHVRWLSFASADAPRGSAAEVALDSKGVSERFKCWVERLEPALTERGQLAEVVLRCPEPTQSRTIPLAVGAYVDVTVEGKILEKVLAIPRPYVRPGDKLWIATAEKKLTIRSADILFKGRDVVLAKSNLGREDLLITSRIVAPIEGMPLQWSTVASENVSAVQGKQDG